MTFFNNVPPCLRCKSVILSTGDVSVYVSTSHLLLILAKLCFLGPILYKCVLDG